MDSMDAMNSEQDALVDHFLHDPESLHLELTSLERDLMATSPPSNPELKVFPSLSSATVPSVYQSPVAVAKSPSTASNFIDESGSDLAGYVPAPRIEQPLPPRPRKKSTVSESTVPEASISVDKLAKIKVTNTLVKRPFGPPGLDLSKISFSTASREDRDFSPILSHSELQDVVPVDELEKEKESEEEEKEIERTHMDIFYDMCGLEDMPLSERRRSAPDLQLRVAMSASPKVLMERMQLATTKYFEDARQKRLKERKGIREDSATSSEDEELIKEFCTVDEDTPKEGSGKKGRMEFSVTSPSTSVTSSTSAWKSPGGAKEGVSKSKDNSVGSQEEKIKCHICPQVFSGTRSRALDGRTEHEKLHGAKGKMHKCAYCNFASDGKWVITKHEKLHVDAGEEPLDRNNEPQSDGESSSGEDVEIVVKKDEGKKKCRYCPQRVSPQYISWHEENHSSQEGAKFSCQYCTFATNAPLVFAEHQKVHTNDTEQNEGGTLVESEEELESEDGSEYEEDEEVKGDKVRCSYCPQLISQSNLGRHEKLHFLKNPQFRCRHCTFGSSALRCLSQHQKVHQNETKQPTGRQSWNSGESSEEEEGDATSSRLKCAHCPQLCSIQNIKRHEEMHFLDDVRYECDYCSYSSDSFESVRKHEKLHGKTAVKKAVEMPVKTSPNSAMSTPKKNPQGKTASSSLKDEQIEALKEKLRSALRIRLDHMVMDEPAVDRRSIPVVQGAKRPLNDDDPAPAVEPVSKTRKTSESAEERLKIAMSVFLPPSISKSVVDVIVISSDEEVVD